MSIIKAIYKAEPIIRPTGNSTITAVSIKYNGQSYTGTAICHPDDKDFYSRKVGQRIALSRARIAAMKAELKREKNKYKITTDFCRIMTNDLTLVNESSMFKKRFFKLLNRTAGRIDSLEKGIIRERNSLKEYLKGLDKAINSVTRMRNKDKNN